MFGTLVSGFVWMFGRCVNSEHAEFGLGQLRQCSIEIVVDVKTDTYAIFGH